MARIGEARMAVECCRAELRDIQSMRDIYRQEMNCQIIHDSIHARLGWTQEYVLRAGGRKLGYGSVAVAGPWHEKPTVYEYFVLPPHRARLFDGFSQLLTTTGTTRIETQSNDPLLTVMVHTFVRDVTSESILFQDKLTTRFLL